MISSSLSSPRYSLYCHHFVSYLQYSTLSLYFRDNKCDIIVTSSSNYPGFRSKSTICQLLLFPLHHFHFHSFSFIFIRIFINSISHGTHQIQLS